MKKMISVLMAIVIVGLTACAPTASASVLKSDVPRDEGPETTASEVASVVGGNSEFALELYRELKNAEGNLFYSPYSISVALAMTYAGARGETEKQMADTLHFNLPQDSLHPALNGLDLDLAGRGEGAKGKDGEGFRLNIVNAIWGQKDYSFLTEFLDTMAENYGAGLRILNFIEQPEPSRIIINDWVSDETEQRIEDLIPEGMIDSDTRLVLTNAIYFNAAWQYPFDENSTADGTFNLLDESTVTVPMMRQTESFGYASGDGYQAVELPYDGYELSMVVLLPDEGQFESFEDSLDYSLLEETIDALKNRQVALTMPKYEFVSEFKLKQTLSTMGMPVAFSGGADFSGMTGNQDLFISQVVHKAFVDVDEAGTEAAAATAVIMKQTAMPAEPIAVNIDRPFIFLIRDIETGAILFTGRVTNPAD